MRAAGGAGALAAAAIVTVAVPVALLWNRVPAAPQPVASRVVLRPAAAGPATRALFAGGLDDPSIVEVAAGARDDVPVLVGVVGRLPDAVALVRGGEGGGRSRAVAVGALVAGWRLEGLAGDGAVFARDGERVRVRLATD